MIQMSIYYNAKALLLSMLLWPLFLAYTISASPASPGLDSVPAIPISDYYSDDIVTTVYSSNTTPTIPEDVSSRLFKSYFVIVGVVVVSFVIISIYLLRRRKLQCKEENVENAACRNNSNVLLARVASPNPSVDCQAPTHQENIIYEGLDGRGEAPPPYIPSSKSSNNGEVGRIEVGAEMSETPVTQLDRSSIEPPPYNQQTAAVRNEDDGNSSPTRPLSCHIPGPTRNI